MEAAGFELVSDQAKPEHPAAEGVFFVIRYRPPSRGFRLRQGLVRDREAKLYVSLDLARVGRAVEEAVMGSFA